MAAPVLEIPVRSVDDARAAAVRAAALCPHAVWAESALFELLVNAVEHGNLGISHADKLRLRADGTWDVEVARRLGLPEYAGRRAWLRAWREEGAWHFEIADEGEGFDWQVWMDLDAGRSAAVCGRGIALARLLAFPDLRYLDDGRRVRCSLADG